MVYVEVLPAPSLRAHIQCYWMLSGSHLSYTPEPILPDGGREVVFHLGDHFDEWIGSTASRQPSALLVVDICRPVTVAPSGVIDTVGIRFRPGGAYPFFAAPLTEPSHAVLRLADLWPETESLRQRLGDRAEVSVRSAILDRFLVNAGFKDRIDPGFDRLMRYIRNHRETRVSTLSAICGISARQVERRFLNRVGVSPKTLLRVLRFADLVRKISGDAVSWADAALDHGYYDQSHMIHEFRRFSGMTPREFAGSVLPLNDSFHQGSTVMSDFSNI